MNAFHVSGGLFAAWAVVVAVLGITREGFPGSGQRERVVGAISVLLMAAAVGTAIYTAAAEKHEIDDEEEGAALVAPR